PAAALVNEQGDILYLHGKAGIYLELPSGEVSTSNILKMAREGLHRGLVMALHKATVTDKIVRSAGHKIRIDGELTTVNLTISPVIQADNSTAESPLYLVVFEEMPCLDSEPASSAVIDKGDSTSDVNNRVHALSQEIHAQEEFLQTSKEKLETSNEELKSSNEEIQSMNEELQSTNEELETSKEELQSVNDELSTVNAELQKKVTDLSRSNNDMNNLLAGTGIGTVFVDHQLCILRFTPDATKIINLILSDLGRPVDHIVSNLRGYNSLKEDIKSVLDTLIPKEMEVQTKEGKWYIMRIQPYRTLDNIIEGAVITFVDISELVRMREALSEANQELSRLATVVRDANDAITVQDLDGHILAWNPGAVRMYGWSEAEALKMNIHDRLPKAYREESLNKFDQLNKLEILPPYRSKRIRKDGTVLEAWITSTALVDKEGEIYAIATTEREAKPVTKK
ncbi:MAG: PAS domain-containing protein, partial [Thiovulaceae bacterium]|nr:PAS domain-containing protein [Sulfurimonadaceae bacterium]